MCYGHKINTSYFFHTKQTNIKMENDHITKSISQIGIACVRNLHNTRLSSQCMTGHSDTHDTHDTQPQRLCQTLPNIRWENTKQPIDRRRLFTQHHHRQGLFVNVPFAFSQVTPPQGFTGGEPQLNGPSDPIYIALRRFLLRLTGLQCQLNASVIGLYQSQLCGFLAWYLSWGWWVGSLF